MRPLLIAASRLPCVGLVTPSSAAASRCFCSQQQQQAAAGATCWPTAATEDVLYVAPAAACPGTARGVTVRPVPGKGRGVFAAQALSAGQLLVAAEAASVLLGPVDQPPDPEQLASALRAAAARASGAAAALQHLFDGSAASTAALPDIRSLAALQGGPRQPSPPCPSPAQAAALARLNAFGDSYEDLAAAAASQRTAHSQVGLWPAFALFNHSCAPNAVHYVSGDKMVIRAAGDIPQGQEVVVSYLGRELLAPAAARQAVLEERYGFRCVCPRCQAEGAAPPQLRQRVAEAYVTVAQVLKPEFLRAVEAQDAQQLQEVYRRLQQLHGEVAAGLQQPLPQAAAAAAAAAAVQPPAASPRQRQAQAMLGAAAPEQASSRLLDSRTVTYLQASLYDLYELMLFCESLLGSGSESEQQHMMMVALGRCFEPISWVCRGDELHVFLACQLAQVAQQLRGPDSEAAALARDLLMAAMRVRYGPALSPQLQEQLIQASQALAQEFLPCL